MDEIKKQLRDGLFVVGIFFDNEFEDKPTIGVLEYIRTEQKRGEKEKLSFCTECFEYQMFRPVEFCASKEEAEAKVRELLDYTSPV